MAGGVTSFVLFLAHGSHFLALRTHGVLHERAVNLARRLAPVAFAIVAASLFGSLFAWLYPNAMAASEGPALSLHMAASTPYTLQVMTVVAAIFTPLVLLYQGWTYWVFRHRVKVEPG